MEIVIIKHHQVVTALGTGIPFRKLLIFNPRPTKNAGAVSRQG